MAPGIPRSSHALFALLATALLAIACDPEIPIPSINGQGDNLAVTLDPPAPLDAAPPVWRARIAPAGASIDPTRVMLAQGHLGPAHLREIQRDELSKALSKRILPAIVWREDPSDEGSAVVVAPIAPLDAGELYAIAAGDPPEAFEIRVAPADDTPLLPRLWPPAGGGATTAFGVWCGDEALPEIDVSAALDPLGPAGRIRRGAAAGAAGARCVRFEATGDPPGDASWSGVPPPSVSLPGTVVGLRLDPRPFTIDVDPAPIPPLPCEADEIPFGPGCARVQDDRIAGRAPDAPLLWAISGAGLDRVFAAEPGDPFLLAGLPPATSIALDIVTIDGRGAARWAMLQVTTSAPMPHVVLNEVLANPIGPEPGQEWVEIVNDGLAPADLDGYSLIDIGGETILPHVALAPGAFALIVNEAFAEDDAWDAPPAPGTTIVRVPKLGKNGLTNAGEPLSLTAGGVVLSRLPIAPKPKAGQSLARRSPGAPDGLVSSFFAAAPTPGGPNAP